MNTNLQNQAINAAKEYISQTVPFVDPSEQKWFFVMAETVSKLICENKVNESDSEEKVISLVIQAVKLVRPHMMEALNKARDDDSRNMDADVCSAMFKAIAPLSYLPKGKLFKVSMEIFVSGSAAHARFGETAQMSINKALERALNKGLCERAVMYATDVPLTVIISMAGRDCLFAAMTEGESYRYLLKMAEKATNLFFESVSEGVHFIDAHKMACEEMLGKN